MIKIQGKYLPKVAAAYNLTTGQTIFPRNIKREINYCRNNPNIRFIFFSFINIIQGQDLSHENMIVIDLVNKTIERFEPYGQTFFFANKKKSEKAAKEINNFFNYTAKDILGLNDFKYIPPAQISPKVGIQSLGDSYCGMCVTIGMMYLQMRLMNPDKNPRSIVNYFVKMPREKLRTTILQYAKYVEKTLKRDPYFVKQEKMRGRINFFY
jgi:hypothetical protein